MADITISGLTLTASVDPSMQLPSDNTTGDTVKMTIAQLESYISSKVNANLPDYTGSIRFFALNTTTPPTVIENCLLVDGSAKSTTDFPELFDKIGYRYGGSGETFYLPPKGRFIRCWDDTLGDIYTQDNVIKQTTVTSTSAGGVTPTASFKGNAASHDHDYELSRAYDEGTAANGDFIGQGQNSYVRNGTTKIKPVSLTPSGSVTVSAIPAHTHNATIGTGSETRPDAIIYYAYIQYKKLND